MTVASLATIMHSRPDTRPMPVMMPAAGQSSSYIPSAASGATSRNGCRVEQTVDPVARQQLAALDVPGAGALGSAERRFGQLGAQLLDEVHMRLAVGCR